MLTPKSSLVSMRTTEFFVFEGGLPWRYILTPKSSLVSMRTTEFVVFEGGLPWRAAQDQAMHSVCMRRLCGLPRRSCRNKGLLGMLRFTPLRKTKHR